jgi:hypothetical protein
MKLDVANHQIRSFHYPLIEDENSFQRGYFETQLQYAPIHHSIYRTEALLKYEKYAASVEASVADACGELYHFRRLNVDQLSLAYLNVSTQSTLDDIYDGRKTYSLRNKIGDVVGLARAQSPLDKNIGLGSDMENGFWSMGALLALGLSILSQKTWKQRSPSAGIKHWLSSGLWLLSNVACTDAAPLPQSGYSDSVDPRSSPDPHSMAELVQSLIGWIVPASIFVAVEVVILLVSYYSPKNRPLVFGSAVLGSVFASIATLNASMTDPNRFAIFGIGSANLICWATNLMPGLFETPMRVTVLAMGGASLAYLVTLANTQDGSIEWRKLAVNMIWSYFIAVAVTVFLTLIVSDWREADEKHRKEELVVS